MSTVRANSILDSSGGNTAQINGMTPTAQSLQGFRNRIIDGDMRIDQRNNGASVTASSAGTYVYTLDRWAYYASQANRYTVQQNAGAVTPPAGYTNYLGVTSTSAYSVTTNDQFNINQRIEGFNTADLAWGTSSAQTVTLSFWVRSSLTGPFGGFITNAGTARFYPFSFTISAANTWEQKTITIAGDTTGTWGTGNGTGIWVSFSLGAGSGVSGTGGAWTSSSFLQPTGSTSVVGTNGATFYITGVQLEAGSVATPFERRDYGRELIMCQRYCEVLGGSSEGGSRFNVGMMSPTNSTTAYLSLVWQVKKRASPTLTFVNSTQYRTLGINQGGACSLSSADPNTTSALIVIGGTGYTAGAGNLVQSQDGTTPSIIISAEL